MTKIMLYHQLLTYNICDCKKETFDLVRELYNANNPGKDSQLADEFDKHVKSVMLTLSSKLE